MGARWRTGGDRENAGGDQRIHAAFLSERVIPAPAAPTTPCEGGRFGVEASDVRSETANTERTMSAEARKAHGDATTRQMGEAA